MLKRKRARVERAQVRQAAYDLLTTEQKLDRAQTRAGFSVASSATREIRRLAKELFG